MIQVFRITLAAAAFWAALPAQVPRTPEPLTSWPYFKEIPLAPGGRGLLNFVLDRETLDKARADHADLRLYDREGREIPYALRIRREVDTHDAHQGREFNRAVEGGSALISCDLGETALEHNEVDIETAGSNFRRMAEVQGSPDGARWSTLVSQAILFRFTADGRSAEQQAVSYPASRFRFLRVRVDRDPQVDRGAPEIHGLRVRRSVRIAGEMLPIVASVEGREADRVNARPASIWHLDLGGRVPLQKLTVTTGEGTFFRPFRLEIVDDPAALELIASGNLVQRQESSAALPAIEFTEHFARRLKLTVIDDRNEPLAIQGVTAMGAARQIVFDSTASGDGPMRLYYGNAKALAPHYDLDARVPADAVVPLTRLVAGPQRHNPGYRPELKPFSERSPWAVYLILAAACAALAGILINIAKASNVQTEDPASM